MSGNSTPVNVAATGSSHQLVLRYAMGATLIMLVAMIADYRLSYLTPVLALNFLAPGAKPLDLKTSVAFLVTILVASTFGVLFTGLFLDYPLVFLPLLVLAVFLIYFTEKFRKMKVWLIIALLVIPMASMQSASLGGLIAANLFINACIAVALVTVVNFIFHYKTEKQVEEKQAPVAELPENVRFKEALKKILVVMPVLLVYFIFNLADSILVLIFITILSMNPATSNKKAGLAIIFANFGGGMAAILAFNLLTIVPEIWFLGMLVLLAGLIFGQGLFSGKPIAQMYGMAFSTFLLILGNVTSFRGEAGEQVWSRIFQLGIVVVYIVIAFATVNYFSARKTSTEISGV